MLPLSLVVQCKFAPSINFPEYNKSIASIYHIHKESRREI